MVSDPYKLVPPGTNNPGLVGTSVAWSGFTQFWGEVVNQAYADLGGIMLGDITV